MWRYCTLLLCFFVVSIESQGLAATTTVKCGEKVCNLYEYCSKFDGSCQLCSDICNSTHHNFDKYQCEERCQTYLHDIRYVKLDGGVSGNEDLKATVKQLSNMVTVTLTLVCLLLVVLAFFLCFQFYRWKEKKNITFASLKDKLFGKKTGDVNTAATNNVPEPSFKKGGDLRLDITSNASHSDHSPVTLSTSISRRPAEDSTLDYAYDNHGMTPASR
ncbi:protein grindelwald [Diorhabda carinulata]|uniref:protein grindelwald n=1 Tax=Diorhabda sublineata TaxID=1163346 RepID=UPI0024E14A21|nr:protein grindelwald [Diorhabda sublineata]XP_057666867.1 protein grindelwald [Diorhabda carinulata]